MPYNYELALIMSVKLTDDAQKKILDEAKKYITASGKVEEAKLFGKKRLAYPVKKETEGFYYIMKFSLEGKETVGVLQKLTLNEGILRYLLIRR